MKIYNKIEKYLKESTNRRSFVDEIGEFWVVTEPTEVSELLDILFKSNIKDIMLQSRGGLDLSDIRGIYKNKNKAKKVAMALLNR